MPGPSFITANELITLIDTYFIFIEGEFHFETKSGKEPKGEGGAVQKLWDREPEPATISGLAFFLGFDSRQAFDDYETDGEFSSALKRGHLRIEAVYEKKLHLQSPTGAIFALKNMGWNDKTEGRSSGADIFKILKIEIIETGPKPAENEKEVIL